jgi:AraC-like DNA-binding protein
VSTATLSRRTLLSTEEITVSDVRCRAASGDWSEQERSGHYGLVLLRNGVFVRRSGGRDVLLDPTVAYFERPDTVQQIAHPAPGGDLCTSISLSERLVSDLCGGEPDLPDGTVFTEGSLDLQHRALMAKLAWSAAGDDAVEQVVCLVSGVLGRWRPERVRRGRPATVAARRHLIDRAREIVAMDPAGHGLTRLARLLGVSSHHLSRVFVEETGSTLTSHRNRLRVRLALERIEGGERNLTKLAADLGFADHAHMTRTVRREVGCPPLHITRLLQQRD